MAKNQYAYMPLLDVNAILAYGAKVGGVTPYPMAKFFLAKQFETMTHAR